MEIIEEVKQIIPKQMSRRQVINVGLSVLGSYTVGVAGCASYRVGVDREMALKERAERATNLFRIESERIRFSGDKDKDLENAKRVVDLAARVYAVRFNRSVNPEYLGSAREVQSAIGRTFLNDYPRSGERDGRLVMVRDAKPEVTAMTFFSGIGKTHPSFDQDQVAIWTLVNQYVRRQADLVFNGHLVNFGLRHNSLVNGMEYGGMLDGAAANLITNSLVGKKIEQAAVMASDDVYRDVINRGEMDGALWLEQILIKTGLTIGSLESMRRSSDSKAFASVLGKRLYEGGVRPSDWYLMLSGMKPPDFRTADDLMTISNQLRPREFWRVMLDRITAK